MESLLVLLGLYLFVVLLILPIWTILKINGHSSEMNALRSRLRETEAEIDALRQKVRASGTIQPATAPLATGQPIHISAPTSVSQPTAPIIPASVVTPPAPVEAVIPPAASLPPPPVLSPHIDTPVLDAAKPRPVYVPPPPKPGLLDNLNWEQFMGAKLFAWLGGLALFLGVAFFVKYSFEHNLIPAEVRVALGFLFALGLIITGLKINRERYAITAQTLIATGIVSLYAVTFACRSIYHFEFFDTVPTFLLMVLITAAAFVLAVRLNAQVVALLGMLGGFLTPVLLSTGVDNPPGLFGYLALLDVGLIAVVFATRWRYLVPLSAAGTVIMTIGWAQRFLEPVKAPVAMIVCLGFSALYLGAVVVARRREESSSVFSWSAATFPLVGFGFAFAFLDYATVVTQAPLCLSFVLALDAFLLIQAWRDETLPRLHLAGGFASFGWLSAWTAYHLTDDLLPWALAAYLLFAALHTVFPIMLERQRPECGATWWSQFFPPLTLLLLLVPLLNSGTTSFLYWPAILLIDVLAIGIALFTASLASVGVVLVLTLLATAVCIFKIPGDLALPGSLLLIIGGFAVFFFGAGLWLVRKLGARLSAAAPNSAPLGDVRAQLPAFASLLPFLLLIMAGARLNVPDPAMLFGLGLLLVVLTLGLARLLTVAWLPACALAGMAALEFTWHSRHFSPDAAADPLVWYVGFYFLFTVYPFVFRRTFASLTGPWAVAALSGLAHFWMIYQTLKINWPADFLGLIPALFAVAPLISLGAILQRPAAGDSSARLNQLAWFGGVALFFITLIFPIQFERQWLTVAWALEGVALLWLFHRVPHPGLRGTGVVLLLISFARLALNPAVLSYHTRGDTAVLNWYLYAYGLATVALFTGARLLAPPRERVLGSNVPPLLNTLGVILAFLLLNLEIADYFTTPGQRVLTFTFSGNFARDMTYTIAWALFALGLLAAGIWRQARAARYAALALLGFAVLKLFFHDLARLAQLYRIGALFGVAVIAILASFAYQRFLPAHDKTPPPQS